MKINLLLAILFSAALFYGSVQYSHGITGTTKLNGDGCVCHRLSPDPAVSVWIEGPDSVEVNQTVTYRVFLTGGPAVAGGYNAATRTGILEPSDNFSVKMGLELTHSNERLFQGDTLSWEFLYTAPSAVQWDTLYATAQSVNNDHIPNNLDRWNYSENFPVKVVLFVPVELISFTADAGVNIVTLNWSTASETNNSGFEIQRRGNKESEWMTLGFVEGHNTTTHVTNYSYADNSPLSGESHYRLKQIDYDGKYSYSEVILVMNSYISYSLEQNYPNPFNPSTNIIYRLGSSGDVELEITDIQGKRIALLINEYQEAGLHSVEFNASGISSGVYFYRIKSGAFVQTKKMILLQ